MRIVALVFASVLTVTFYGCAHTNAVPRTRSSPSAESGATAKVDFATQIRPILEARCQPCHFSGGKVYQRMPFDRAETIKTLGTKLFTRIKDENERRLISDFLAQE